MDQSKRISELAKHKIIVFGFEHYNPLDQIRTFGTLGINVIGVFINDKKKFASKSKYLSEIFFVETIDEGYKLICSKWKTNEKKAFLITSDDIITSFLDGHYDELKDYFYLNNCTKEGNLTMLMDKQRQKQIALKVGFDVPKILEYENIEEINFPVITKTKDSLVENWKSYSKVINNKNELDEIIKEYKNIYIEKYIDRSNEMAVEGYSYNDGNNTVAKLYLKRFYLVKGAPGKKLICDKLTDKNLLSLIESYMKKIQFNGVFEMEFLIDQNNQIYFSEVNLRNSGLGIATTVAGASNLLGWCYSCLEGTDHVPEEPSISRPLVGMDDFADFKLRVITNKQISPFKWYKEFKNSDFTFYYDKKDKKPFRKAFLNKFFR